MTPLGKLLEDRIAREGPISVAEYMGLALMHPEHGYYVRRQPLGARGDFTTAPEISQMFGEIVGLWCVSVWEQMGRPDAFRLVELGPGRGTLMADTLRATRIRPAFRAAARVHLVEPSPALRRAQQATLEDPTATWHMSFAEAAAGERLPLILVANEVFDALPIHQLERTEAGWRERLVGFDPAAKRLRFETAERPTPLADLVPAALRDAPPGSLFEVCPAGRELAGEIAGHIAGAGGAALVIDYGHGGSALGDTLQAVRRHRFHDVLADPGEADITAHVDFEALAAAAAGAGARTHGPVPQGAFLRRLGIEARAAVLLRSATAAQARDVPAALRRLIDPDQMGTLFKALAITHPELPAPAGFEAS